MSEESSPVVPSIEQLRAVAAEQGVHPDDADLQAARGFLDAILPALADLERRLPPETPLAEMLPSEGEKP